MLHFLGKNKTEKNKEKLNLENCLFVGYCVEIPMFQCEIHDVCWFVVWLEEMEWTNMKKNIVE